MQITLRNYLVTDKIHELTLEKHNIEDKALLDGRAPNDEEKLNIQEIENKISYMNQNANRTYTAPFIPFEMYKDYYAIKALFENSKNEVEIMANVTTFVCHIFGNQFTEEQFCRGIAMHKLNETILGIFKDTEKMLNEGVESNTQY